MLRGGGRNRPPPSHHGNIHMIKIHAQRIDALRKAITNLEFALEPDAGHEKPDKDALMETLEEVGDAWVALDQDVRGAHL